MPKLKLYDQDNPPIMELDSLGLNKQEDIALHDGIFEHALGARFLRLADLRVTDAEEGQRLATERLVEVREKIGSLSQQRQDIFNQQMDDQAPLVLQDEFEEWSSEYGGGWLQWLSSEDGANNKQLEYFLRWYNRERQKLQNNPELVAELLNQQEEYAQSVNLGVKEGWLNSSAAWRVQDIRHIEVIFGDYFDLGEFEAYAMTHKPKIVLPARVTKMKKVAKHEYNHQLLGRAPWRWLNEALTEHIAQVMDGLRDIDDVSPHDDEMYYSEERRLLNLILTICQGDITIEDMTRVYSNQEAEKAWAIFDQKVSKALGGRYSLASISAKVQSRQEEMSGLESPDYEELSEACESVSKTLKLVYTKRLPKHERATAGSTHKRAA